MLAAAAVRGDEPAGADLGDPGAAARARLSALVVDGQEVADLASRTSAARVRAGRRSRRPASCASPSYSASTSSAARRRALAERQQPRGVEDLVAVGVADPGHERLVAQQVLELARMAPDPLPPDVEGQRRDRRRRGPGPVRPGPARPARRRPAAGRSCPSGSGRGSGPRPVRRRPAARRAPRVQRAASRRPPVRGPKPSTTAVLAGSLSPGAASWNRPVSIGLQAIASRSRSISRNLPRRRIDRTRWPTRAASSAGVPRTASGPGALGGHDRPAGERGMEGIGDHGQIGQFGHGAAIVAVGRRVLDSPGPKRQDS